MSVSQTYKLWDEPPRDPGSIIEVESLETYQYLMGLKQFPFIGPNFSGKGTSRMYRHFGRTLVEKEFLVPLRKRFRAG